MKELKERSGRMAMFCTMDVVKMMHQLLPTLQSHVCNAFFQKLQSWHFNYWFLWRIEFFPRPVLLDSSAIASRFPWKKNPCIAFYLFLNTFMHCTNHKCLNVFWTELIFFKSNAIIFRRYLGLILTYRIKSVCFFGSYEIMLWWVNHFSMDHSKLWIF